MQDDSNSILQSNYVGSITVLGGMLVTAALFLTIILMIGIIINTFQNSVPDDPTIEAIGIFVNGILTIGLLYLYHQSSKTQESQEKSLSEQAKALNSQASTLSDHTKELATQRQILAEQRNLAEYSQKSIISITDFHFVPLSASQERHDFQENPYLYYSEFLELDISNYGAAPAHDFHIELYICTGDEDFSFISPLLRESWKETSDKLYSEKATPVLLNREGAGISSNDEKRTMSATLLSPIEDIPDSWVSKARFGVYKFSGPSGVLEHITDNVDGDVTIGTHLWFKDGTGTRGPKYLRWVNISTEDLIGREGFVDDDYDMEEDRIDLSRIFHTVGTTADDDDIPVLQHPAER
ncbi:hypothetical protein [Natronorubrum daqingense]|uniref:Uncharacterized protein n=1 Tax=Natronorubrum daqingense TaxID=588898 RepID=A0A1N7CA08_9EURY|nr:hypothetical protein [Natronorubrum daqingense]SIR60439.1 hypothetical protein SAMN05421809_1595 [Natronorubrum daqingense]